MPATGNRGGQSGRQAINIDARATSRQPACRRLRSLIQLTVSGEVSLIIRAFRPAPGRRPADVSARLTAIALPFCETFQ